MNPIAWLLSGEAGKALHQPLRFLSFCLVLFGIPLALIWGLHRELLESRMRQHIEQRREELEMQLGFHRLGSPNLRNFGVDLCKLWAKAMSGNQAARQAYALKARLKRSFSGLVDMVVLDSEARRVPGISDPVLPDSTLKFLLQDARDFYSQNYRMSEERKAIYCRELGPLMAARSGSLLNQMVRLSLRGTWDSMMFAEVTGGYHGLFLFRGSRSWPEMVMSLRLDLLSETWPELLTCGIDIRRPIASQGRKLGKARRWLRPLLRDPEAQTGGTVVKGNWLMIMQPVRQHYRAIYALPIGHPPDESPLYGRTGSQIVGVALFLVFLFLSWTGWHWFFSTPPPFCSLRLKLGLLFLYLVGLPLLLLGLAAWKTLGDYRSMLEQGLWARQQRSLQEVRSRYTERLGRMEKVLKQALKSIERAALNNPDLLVSIVENIRTRFTPQLCDIINVEGKVIAHAANSWDRQAKQLSSMLQSIGAAVCADLNLGAGRNLSPREQLMTASGEMMGMNIGLMYSALIGVSGRSSPSRSNRRSIPFSSNPTSINVAWRAVPSCSGGTRGFS